MTFKEKVKEHLVASGMFDSQAEAVFQEMKASDNVMLGRWDDDVSEYPGVMLNVILVSVRRYALEWIDKNIPQAWFRGCLED